ncbi:MAG: PDZ domain-containing protein [Akkermansia sp.]|nr:PDZ domain-containing protein [Akkermansia sp.]
MKSYVSLLITLMMLPAGAAPALLGLRAETTEQAVQQSFAGQIPAGTGLTVYQLTPGTPAAKQLQRGDVLLQADGSPLRTPEELADIVRRKQAGDSLHLVLLRHGARLELTLQLAARPEQAVLSREQQLELNRLLLLLVPHGEAVVNTPAVRRQLLALSSSGIARKDEYATCTLYLRHNRYLITITSTERSLSITSNHPEVPDAFLRADFYQRDTRRLPEKLEQLLLNAEFYRP